METHRRTKVLVVDDEQIVHESIRRILEFEDFEVVSVLRSFDAMIQLEGTQFDLVLTDLMMPEGNGMDVVRAVGEKHPSTGVIILTGYPTIDSAIESLKLGALDYLRKPFTPDELLETIRRSQDKRKGSQVKVQAAKLLQEAEKALAESTEIDNVLKIICKSVFEVFAASGSAVLLLNPKKQTLETVSVCGLSNRYLNKGPIEIRKSITDALESGQTSIVGVNHFDAKLQFPDAARQEALSSIVSVPLKRHDRVLGFLRIYNTHPKDYEQSDIQVLEQFAELAAGALVSASKYQQTIQDIQGMKEALRSE